MANRIYLILAMAFTLGSLAVPFLPTSEAPASDLSAQQPLHDLGTVHQQQVAKATFQLRNNSTRKIELLRVITDCHCTAAEFNKRELEPQETATLHVTFDAGTSRGRVQHPITIQYMPAGEDRLRTLALAIAATVTADYDVQPARLEFVPGRAEKQPVTLSPTGAKPLEIAEAYCTHSAFTALVMPHTGDARERQVMVYFDPAKWDESGTTVFLIVSVPVTSQPELRLRLNVIPEARADENSHKRSLEATLKPEES